VKAALALAACLAAAPLAAEDEAGSRVRAELLSEVRAVRPGEPFRVAVRLSMDPGWHTYWKYPGDSGLPTRVEWTLPEGLEAGPLQWPAPERIEVPPLVNYGYHGEAWLLATLRPAPSLAGKRADLRAKVKWMECAEVCVPGEAELALVLPVAAEARPDVGMQKEFQAAAARLPARSAGWTFEAARKGDKLLLEAAPPAGDRAEKLRFFPGDAAAARLGEPAVSRRKEAWRLEFAAARAPQTLRGLIVAEGRGGKTVLEIDTPVKDRKETKEDTP
jgi:DsbC/DsbD-like thiol-disulfide interchange protein